MKYSSTLLLICGGDRQIVPGSDHRGRFRGHRRGRSVTGTVLRKPDSVQIVHSVQTHDPARVLGLMASLVEATLKAPVTATQVVPRIP